MIGLGNVLLDVDLAQPVTIYRQTGSFVAGVWTPGTPTVITTTGVITIPSATDLDQVPEGDRQKGAIVVFVPIPLQVTSASGTSDQVLWARDGNYYRASQLFPFGDYGFYKCICIRMVNE